MLNEINIQSSVPAYLQIENDIQFAIASGELKSGDKLPAVREQTERLKLNLNTVAKAYRDLEVMGLVYARRGMGVFIEKGARARCEQRCWTRAVERLHEVAQEAMAAGISKTDLSKIVSASYSTNCDLYAEVPKKVLVAGKG